MGLGPVVIELLQTLQSHGELPAERSIVEIGAQQIARSFLEAREEATRLAASLGINTPWPLPEAGSPGKIVHGSLEHLSESAPPARLFWEWLGYRYASIDIDGSPGSIPADLNCDTVPLEHRNRYAIVTNFGTTEHVANQENAFRVIHDLTMVNGLMIHQLPAQGFLNHGLVNYNAKFFWLLARSNGYSFVDFDFQPDPTPYGLSENIVAFAKNYARDARARLADLQVHDCCITLVLRKVFDIEYVPPLDVPTGTETDNEQLARRYWTVFTPNAFARLGRKQRPLLRGTLRRWRRRILSDSQSIVVSVALRGTLRRLRRRLLAAKPRPLDTGNDFASTSGNDNRARSGDAFVTPIQKETANVVGELPICESGSKTPPLAEPRCGPEPNPPPNGIDADFRKTLDETLDGLRSKHLAVSWGDRLLTIDKTQGFKHDPAFTSAFEAIQGSIQYDEYNGPDGIAWRLNTLCWAAKCALRVGGDFVECGLHKGDMAWVVLNAVGPERIPRFFLFDSFEGFSEKYSSPQDFPLNPGFLEFANKEYREQGLYERVRDRFARYPNVQVIKGFLPEVLDIECPERIGFLHIDLNSPRAEVAVLERLFDRVVPGGVIVFDDYGWKLFEKQKVAEDELLAAHGYEILELPTGQGLVIKR
jgi:O-methyltransferase